MRSNSEGTPRGEHYFTSSPAARSAPRQIELTLPDLALRLTTDAGVFSADRVDPGTKLLLLRAPAPPTTGNLLDLGCGAGPIALTMARRAPDSTVWAIDVNERAVALCQQNAAANGIGNVRAVAPDDVPADVRFDAIWSNPPIRIGKPALHEMLLVWFGRLHDGAAATTVVHKNLGADSLQRWLSDQGYPTERLGSAQGYRILRSAR